MRTIPQGAYVIAVSCPICKAFMSIPGVIEPVLRVKAGERKLSLSLTAQAIMHRCADPEKEKTHPPLFPDEPLAITGDASSVVVDLSTGEIL